MRGDLCSHPLRWDTGLCLPAMHCHALPAFKAAEPPRPPGRVVRAGAGEHVPAPLKGVITPLPSQDEDSEFTLASDFEIGHFFRERIVPRAVLYFTGEAIEDDDNVCVCQPGRRRGCWWGGRGTGRRGEIAAVGGRRLDGSCQLG